MNHHPPPPPPPPGLDSHTAAQVLRQTSSIFWSHLLTFVFLSFLIFAFRSNVENGTHLLTAFIDRDPSLRSLLSRLDISGRSLYYPDAAAAAHHHPRRHGRAFLHLTRVGTLDDDFFSGDEDNDHSLFGSNPKIPPNGSFVILNNFDPRFGFSNHVSDNGIRVSEIVRSGFSLKLLETSSKIVEDNNNNAVLNKVRNSLGQSDDDVDDEAEKAVDLQFLIKGFELRRHDASSLFFLICLLSTAYGYVILVFLVTYSWVLGIVFVLVVNRFLERHRSWIGTIWDGANLGIKRVSGFILMKWAIKDALTQLLGLWFFGEIDDQYSFFKIFLKLKLMPFSIMSPLIQGFEKETAGFLFAWLLLDFIVEFVCALDSWVAIADSRRSGREIVKEGCYLLSTMFKQAAIVKCLELNLCGLFTRWALARYFGKVFATAFQSMIDVYFMVAWLIFYFAVRSKEATSHGMIFGQRDLERFIQGHR